MRHRVRIRLLRPRAFRNSPAGVVRPYGRKCCTERARMACHIKTLYGRLRLKLNRGVDPNCCQKLIESARAIKFQSVNVRTRTRKEGPPWFGAAKENAPRVWVPLTRRVGTRDQSGRHAGPQQRATGAVHYRTTFVLTVIEFAFSRTNKTV